MIHKNLNLMLKIKLIFSLLLLLGIALRLGAQIALAPSFVFIDEHNGVGNIYVSNNSNQAYEVSISFAFGYPDGDADGKLVMNYNDPVAYAQFALDSMIRAFPRSFVLNANEQRTVRVQVLPNQRRKQGYFFTRMKVLAKPQTQEITETVSEGIGTQITFNFEQVTAVFYHRGTVTTGVQIKKLDIKQVDKTLQLRPHLQKMGDAPFIGSMIAELKDSNGNTVAETKSSTTAYFDVIRRLDLNIADVKPGNYKLNLEFITQRNDMAAGDLIQADPLEHEVDVVIK